ncbi:MAG: NAD(P)H-dependent oxidoreductase [Gemmatimonadota bacterium]
MSDREDWCDLGPVEDLAQREIQPVDARGLKLALVHRNGRFTAISGACNHVGGPLGEGVLDGEYVVCPWHFWKFHHETGEGEPGYEADRVPTYAVEVRDGRVYVNRVAATRRAKAPHAPHPLARDVHRDEGPVRVVGISTTMMPATYPRYSTSEALLDHALDHAEAQGSRVQRIRLRDLAFRPCEGFYSKSAHACTWPCSITQMDPTDQMDRVYEAFVHGADVILLATPIRWGAASSLYYRMVERMNCIQNQETIAGRHLLRNKVVGLIITGGQDNVQGLAGQMLGFFAELGCQFPQFPYIAHSRGWSAEDMENNVRHVQESEALREGARGLVERCVEMAELMIAGHVDRQKLVRGGRKGASLRPAG